MKKILLFLIVTINTLCTIAQPYGNEWINYGQPHFKFEVGQEGIHRITGSVINQFGLNFIDPDNFKIFRDGIEIPIFVQQSNGIATSIEFYAYPNDGKFDTRLFNNPNWQIHDRYSLFTDNAVYYLTWNESGNNERFIPTPNSLTNLPPKEDYFMHTSQSIFNDAFSIGEPSYLANTALYNSLFSNGEGFYGNLQFNNSSTIRSFNLATPNVYPGIDAEVYTVVVSWTIAGHHFRVKSGSTTLSEHQFNDYELVKTTNTLNANLLSTSTNITFEAVPTSSGTNRNNPALIEIDYPRDFDFGNQSSFVFEIQGNGNAQYLEIQNLNEQNSLPILYDVTNGYRMVAIDPPGSNIHRFKLPAAIGTRKLVIRADVSATLTNISSLQQLAFTNFNAITNQGDYVLLTHPSFFNSPEVNAYVAHRSGIIGGSHDVIKVNIQQVYDQFGYGIDRHPQAIRNFVDFISDTWTTSVPKHLFIVGKAREYKDFRNNASIRDACLIPTFGNPGSDILLGSDENSAVPKIAIGRLAATNTTIIKDYLDKIIEYDNEYYNFGNPYQTIANKDYMKQIIHLGGGTDLSQQNQFRNYLNSYGNTAKGTSWGANTSSVFKNSSAPIQTLPSELIRNRINDGVSLITFFGHSYAGGFDLSFDDPENYSNEGKYPIFLANGCNSGLIHAASLSISERFVFQPQKGAIAYLSTTDLSSSSSLNRYTTSMYDNFSNSLYAKSIGEVIQKTVEDVEACCGNIAFDMMVAQEMTLHGDPAIPINQYNESDYALEAQNVYFGPSNISTSLDSFTVNLAVYNLGKAVNDSIDVELKRIYPNGNQEVYVQKFAAPYYKDTFSFVLPVNGSSDGLGLNNFNLYVDVNNDVQNELSETNNYLLNPVSLFIGSDDIFPIHPFEFAIVPKQNVTLKASTGNPFAAAKNYIFQIDTSELFNNPLATQNIFSTGGVIEWTPPISMVDSTVYYWRVSADSTAGNPYKWQYSSFIYINNEFPGWNQSHYYQWQKDDFQNVYLDTDREFKFIDIPKEVYVKTGQFPTLFFEEMEWKMDGAQMHNWKMNNCGGGVGFPNGISIAIINNITGTAIPVVNNSTTSSYGPFGNIHCVGIENVITVANFRTFANTPSNHPTPNVPWSSLIINYLNNVPNDYYVLIYSINDPLYSSWDGTLINYLNNLSLPVSNSTNGPMILAYQKNNASFTPITNIGNSFSDIITNTFQINGTWNSGNMESTLIGPAIEWGSFHWDFNALENPSQDIQSVEVYGVNSNVSTFLFNVPSTVLDTALTSIDANQYPYIRLRLLTSDIPDRTPVQLKYWRVLYKKPPEAAINPLKYFSVNKDTLVQGETWEVSVAVENVTDVSMDSLTVKRTLTNASNNVTTSYGINDSLLGFDTLHLSFSQNTLNGYNGINSLIFEANPYEQGHQLEQFHFNNFATINFTVLEDNINPLLDVSFDGRKILDGDLVSAKPEILVELKDENLFLALDDTSLINIYFRYLGPDGNSPGALTRVSYNDINTQFIPSNSTTENKAKVVLNRTFLNDGTYELLVRSNDKSGNTSSSTENRLTDLVYYDYKISFTVENQSRISNILNYPNPFTTQTQFIFTLTGSEIPSYFEIQIMNVKGTVVKQITQEEFGSIHIGLNKSEYWWDGTDKYGDPLANGVYFYRVKTYINNEKVDHYSIEQADRFFEKGIGKMVLIR